MDNREDPGQYYPGGSVVPARPEPAAHPVESVNGHAGNVVLNASDVGALPDTTAIPTADTVSGWGFLRKTWANLTAAFASIVHTHTKSNITDFAHSHSQSDVTGLTTALASKQAELVSGTNIKTVNGQSLLGSGNVVIQSGTSAHASTHAAGGADEVTPASIGALASNGTAVDSSKLGGIAASEYAQVGDVPTVVAPSLSAEEDAAASAKATAEALNGKLDVTGGTMEGTLINSEGIIVGEGAGEGTTYGRRYISIDRNGGMVSTTISLPDDGEVHDFPTKTSDLTNDSGFVTASDIPLPARVKNAADTERIDGSGNVYTVAMSYNGGTMTDDTGTVYSNCSEENGYFVWTSSDGQWVRYRASDSRVQNSSDWLLSYQYGKNPITGDVLNSFYVGGRTYTHSNPAIEKQESSNPTARLARECVATTSTTLKSNDCAVVTYSAGMTLAFEESTRLRQFEILIKSCTANGSIAVPSKTYRGDSAAFTLEEGDNHVSFAEQADGSFLVHRTLANTITIGG